MAFKPRIDCRPGGALHADGGSGIGAALGAGRFGKIVTYRYNGALVAVKSVNQCRWDGKRMYIYR